ncbi:DUF1223 domain-containing protein [Chelativorans sp. AA-79]|uniref:DUF1223 domain-containing protein n=1 Tax=Chelativorans sp. AA-79 TaxID=3028735 RepID=UPI0023F75A7C|nr:DUF1223 domain-containing protein [Chelativorans sp. AA-79]WEX09857.1 DUF1223 domain-containing protein [Chelativorans sp. AA-79]
MRSLTARRTILKMGLVAVALPSCFRASRAADRPIAVVELFTSQGCSSCPRADALFSELADRSDLVALAYHVDYWDYLGWKDDLATPENTERQHGYGEVLGTSVYTPQIVINGRLDVTGTDRSAVLDALEAAASGAHTFSADVTLSATSQNVVIDIGKGPAQATGAHIILAAYRPHKSVEIRAGENRGKTIDYCNVVRSYQTIGVWHGKAVRLEFPKTEISSKGGGCAVLVQSVDGKGNPGPVLGAADIPSVV